MNWLRRLFRFPNPTPVAVLAVNEDVQFYEDMRLLESLAEAIYTEAMIAADAEPDIFADWVAQPLLQMIAIPVAGTQPDWPDHAAVLLRYWENEREIARMVDEIEREAA